MERGKRIESFDGEIPLPESIIQHIQLFLNCKEAAQTSILSKSWYNAWATRPLLDFDQRNFQITDGFSEFSKKIMRRYEELNLKIENFRLCMESSETDSISLANELIVNAMKMGVCDLNVEFLPQTEKFNLPHEVLGSKNLVRLSVSGCRIDGKLGLTKLKSLSLRRVCIVGFSNWDITSNCPLIEEFVLSECTCTCKVRISNGATVDITRMLALGSMTEMGKQNVGSIVDGPISPYGNLKCLFLEKIKVDKLLFHDMSRRFPCLKDLSLHWCNGFIGLQLSSPSLERLSIAHTSVLSAKFDVPSLGKFTFSGTSLPFLSFETGSSEWESDISVTYSQNYISSSWLVRLKNFLMKLRLSKISLSLCFGFLFEERFDDIGYGGGLPKPVVENLTLSMNAPTPVGSSVLKGVFWSCRPKFVSQNWLPVGGEFSCDMVKLLCKSLIEEESENWCIPRRHMLGMFGLEKVNVEVFEDSLAEWQPLHWKALLDDSRTPENERKIRFKLMWGLDPFTISLEM